MLNVSEGPVIVVAVSNTKAEEIAGKLTAVGFPVTATTDIGWALEENPSVLILHPEGWESTAKAMLGGFENRENPPPAVFIVGKDETLQYIISPATGYFKEPLDIYQLISAIKFSQARRVQFVHHWPKLLNLKRTADFRNVELALADHAGITVRSDWRITFQNALKERLVANQLPTIPEYEQLLTSEAGKKEIHLLACRLAVGETHFWRYSGQMNGLKTILPGLWEQCKEENKPLRIWSAGCSTGEEPYSIAMAIRETLGEQAQFQVIATDLNPVSLATARLGVYTERSLRNLPTRLLTRFFRATDHRYIISDEVKKLVRFEPLNLCGNEARPWSTKNGPFDAVFCRNVTIYFTHEVSRAVVEICADALKAGGGLFLGSSETIHPPIPGISIVQVPGAFFYQKEKKKKPEEEKPADVQISAEKGKDSEPEPINRIAMFQKGLDAIGKEDFASAELAFNDLIDADSHCPYGNTGTALLLANQGREVESKELLNKIIIRGGEPAETHFVLGILDERALQPESALQHYAKTVKLDPDFFMAHVNSAWIFKRTGRNSAFVSEMKKALAILRRSARIPAWVTGGLGMEAILTMVAEATGESAESE